MLPIAIDAMGGDHAPAQIVAGAQLAADEGIPVVLVGRPEDIGETSLEVIPASEVIELEHLGDDPHVAAVGLISSDVHPTEGAYRYVRDPIRIDGTTAPLRHHAPRLGADTDAILSELE